MAYIPPHKRHSNSKKGPLPTPQLLASQFKTKLNVNSSKLNVDKSGKIVYANHATSRWFAVGLDDNNRLPSSVHLDPIPVEFIERKIGEKPLILVNDDLPEEIGENYLRSPWESIAENVLQDLLCSIKNVRNEMESLELEEVKPTLVARFGKILIYGGPSGAQEKVRRSVPTGTMLGQLKRSFYTNIPTSYMERILGEESRKIGVEYEEEKDLYHVKLSDARRSDVTISCKCRVIKEQKKLQVYKIELNQVRHMVTDISCLPKNLDLRLMLCTKRILTSLEDDEMQCIGDLINSAVVDSNVKGGLRWPFGKASSGDRFSVVGVWHTIAKAYKSPSLRLKVRHADRFDFRTSTGESAIEISLKLKGIVSKLQVQNVDYGLILEMLEDNLRSIWNHFLNCEWFLT
ncbi:DNA ligase [Quillaja saponaria]|uniref:DNA ligase n=1 Tax=Quillaja saponaria TaxID=32244 RepID=A0AAD7Q2D3_QUISA|nr:DNA ligase [Quillaja saponaria]